MKLTEAAEQLGMDELTLQTTLIEEFEDCDEWDEIPEHAMPRIQQMLGVANEVKEMANTFALPDSDNEKSNGNGHLPESEALTIATEYGVSLDFVYAVKDADIQLQVDAEIEFKTGITEAEVLIAAKEAGKAFVFNAYQGNRNSDRLNKLASIQQLKASGLHFLNQKYGINSGQRVKQASEHMISVQKQLEELGVDTDSFFAKTTSTSK